MDELEKAHLDYELRKRSVITNLSSMITYFMTDTKPLHILYTEFLEEAIEFINEKEV